jgi:hypothetical protein
MKKHRHHGIGEALFAHAIAYLKDRGTKTIEFNGVFPAVPLYRRFGFHDKYLALRFVRPPSPCDSQSEQLLTVTADEIVRFDREHSLIDRSAVLTRFAMIFATHCLQSEPGVRPYAFVKPRPNGSVLLALCGRSPDAAIMLQDYSRSFLTRHPDHRPENKNAVLTNSGCTSLSTNVPGSECTLTRLIWTNVHMASSPEKGSHGTSARQRYCLESVVTSTA